MELWSSINNYPKYLVSNNGRVKNKRTHLVLKPRPNKDGYSLVYLYNDNGAKNQRVHRLVVTAFVCDIPEGFEPNHINGDKADNSASNLELVTHSNNLNHAYTTNLHSSKCAVRCLETNDVFHSMSEASRMTGISIASISLAARGLVQSVKGYHFELVPERR